MANAVELDSFDFVRTIATARLLMPKAYIRLSAGREQIGDELQVIFCQKSKIYISIFRLFVF